MPLDDGKTQAWLILSLCGMLTLTIVVLVGFAAAPRVNEALTQIAEGYRDGRRAVERERDDRHYAEALDQMNRDRNAAAAPRGQTAIAVDPRSWITTDDYPPSAIWAEEEGVVSATLDVDNDGRPVACVIDKSSGSAALDTATCAAFMRRGRFNGGVRPGSIRRWQGRRVRWVMPDM